MFHPFSSRWSGHAWGDEDTSLMIFIQGLGGISNKTFSLGVSKILHVLLGFLPLLRWL
jgi:hypothetical protein